MSDDTKTAHPTNAELARRRAAVMPSFLRPLYKDHIALKRGEGCYVWDVDDNRYLDFFGGILTTMIGHNEPSVVAAVQRQAAELMHTSMCYMSEPMISYAEEIARVSGIPDARVFFTPSGSEATDGALIMATAYRGTNQILALRNSYHGRTFGALAVTGHRGRSASSYTGLNVSFVHGGYRMRSPFSELAEDDYTAACIDDLVLTIDTTTSGHVAAMIAEPIQGVGGFVTPPDGFFGDVRKVLDSNDILFISDEVQTGWGRTGEHFWGYEAHGIVPDMITFGKGAGNGIPVAGVVVRAEIADAVEATHSTTFGGNPLSAAAGRATLRRVLEDNLQQNAAVMGQRLVDQLADVVESTDWIADLRGKGLMRAIEITHPDSIEPDTARFSAVVEACRERGLLVGKGGLYDNVIRITPMLNVTADQIDEGAEKLKAAIAEADD